MNRNVDAFYRPTWAEISLDALGFNLASFRRALPAELKIMAVLKADAYGHGAVETAREALRCGADYLAVAFLDEALELRRAGIEAPLLVLGYVPPEGTALAVQYGLTLTVFSEETLQAAARAARGETPVKIHIKLDTGMGRLGVHTHEAAIALIDRALSMEEVEVEALYTHYACADETDKTYTREQYRRFSEIVSHYRQRGVEFPLNHAGNSATAIDLPELSCKMVRLGISLYGFYPSEEVNRTRVPLKPVLSFKTRVVHVKTLPPGSGVSYGATYRTRGYETIATLPVGYADGYSRMLSHKAEVLIRGRRVPVIGRICMDQAMIQVSDLAGSVEVGDEVVLFGQQDHASIPAEELAGWLGTINYEIACMVSHRVPRVYVREGRIERVNNALKPR